MSFLHGVETIRLQNGPVPVNEVKSAVIGLIGSSAQGEPGVMRIIRSREDALEVFNTVGSLDSAFDAIFDHTQVTVITISAGANPSTGDVIGHIPTFLNAFAEFGFFPKILIAPGFSQDKGVAAELISTAAQCRGVALVDCPAGLTPEQAVTHKQTFGQGQAVVCYPQVQIADKDGNPTLDWLSGRLAGVIAKSDQTTGFHASPSNQVISGIIGAERVLSYMPSNKDTELNYVNEMGLVSILNFAGSGYRSFGNRTAAWPFETSPTTFIAWQRTLDIIDESLEYFTLQFLDQPMFSRPEDAATGLLNRVQESVNDYLRALIARGALVSGHCEVRLADNPTAELAAGKLTYTKYLTPPPVAEKITYRTVVDVAALQTVFSALVGASS